MKDEAAQKDRNSEILKLLRKRSLMYRNVAGNLLVLVPSAASMARKPPILRKLLMIENSFLASCQPMWHPPSADPRLCSVSAHTAAQPGAAVPPCQAHSSH